MVLSHISARVGRGRRDLFLKGPGVGALLCVLMGGMLDWVAAWLREEVVEQGHVGVDVIVVRTEVDDKE